MKKILIKKDESAIRQETGEASQLANLVEPMLNELKKFEVDLPSPEEMPEFARNPEAYVKKRIAEELAAENNVRLGKRKQDVSKVINTLDLPSFAPLNDLANKIVDLPARPYKVLAITEDAEGKVNVSVNADWKESLQEKFSKYAETEEEINLYNSIKAVKDAIDNYEANYLNHPEGTSRYSFREKTSLLYFTNLEERYFAIAQRKRFL
jgi:hypothetical protein